MGFDRNAKVHEVTAAIAKVDLALWDGAPLARAWCLSTGHLHVEISSFGAHLASVAMVSATGDRTIVTVPYPAGATSPRGHHGASIGRYANRIAHAEFALDGHRYPLVANEGRHQLHGGPVGFDCHIWSGDAEVIGDTAGVELVHRSPDGDQGYPGTVHATARFSLTEDRLSIEYFAHTDRPTPVNLTNHAYWNLAGGGSLDDHELEVAALHYVAVDGENIPVAGPPASVHGTRFDCRAWRDLASVVAAGGFDHCFVLGADDPAPGARPSGSTVTGGLVHAASLRHRSGHRIEVETDQVGLQVYTGQHLAPGRRGVALETQMLPDTPNRPDFGDATLRPGVEYRSTTVFRFIA